MNRAKILEYFDATSVPYPVHIVGCGAIGSHVCELVARLGFPSVDIYDFDTVEEHNITNQMFTAYDVGAKKVDACAMMMNDINPDMDIEIHYDGLKAPYVVNGIVIMCVDSVALRNEIVNANKSNPNCICISDFRMRLTDAQYYFAEMKNKFEVQALLASMNFTSGEAKEATPKSACGVELSVVYTVKAITSLGMANLVKWMQQQDDYKTTILVDMNSMIVDAMRCKERVRPDNTTTTQA